MQIWHPNLVRLAPNRTDPDFLNIRLQYILARRAVLIQISIHVSQIRPEEGQSVTSNGTNPELFKISFSTFLLSELSRFRYHFTRVNISIYLYTMFLDCLMSVHLFVVYLYYSIFNHYYYMQVYYYILQRINQIKIRTQSLSVLLLYVGQLPVWFNS